MREDLYLRWVLSEGCDLEALRPQLGPAEQELLEGARVHGRCADVHIERPSVGMIGVENAFFQQSGALDAIWIRSRSGFIDGDEDIDDVDGINQVDIDFDRIDIYAWRPCRYGFDELVVDGVTTWRGQGSYLARNTSDASLPLSRMEPELALAGDRVEWKWRGRVVHVLAGGQHESTDDWDNCVDEIYLARFGSPE